MGQAIEYGTRQEICLADLCSVRSWTVRLTDRVAGMTFREYVVSDSPFRSDYTYVSPSLNYEPVDWQFFESEGSRKGLQVEQNGQTVIAYTQRTQDWGWTLSATFGPGRIEWIALANTDEQCITVSP